MSYADLSLKELRKVARDLNIPGYNSLTKKELVEKLNESDSLVEKEFIFDAANNRWALQEAQTKQIVPEYYRVFDQKAVVHTSDEIQPLITRAYNMETFTPISDGQLEEGAEARGQIVGDASGHKHIKDGSAERGQ